MGDFLTLPMEASAVQFMALLVLGTLLSEDLTCVSAGLLAAAGKLPLPAGMLACAAGIWLGDVLLFGIGWMARSGLLRWGWAARLVSGERLAVGERFLTRNGWQVLLATRFLPGSRLPMYLAAGALHYPPAKFMLILAIGAVVWTPPLCWLAMHVGMALLPWLHDWRLWLLVPLVWLLAFLFGRLVSSVVTWRGRRLWVARWKRFAQWEFWPAWAFYLPILPWLGWLALRHRSLTLALLSNPGIRLGGLVMESKSAILSALMQDNPHQEAIATWTLLATGPLVERMQRLRDFMTAQQLVFPLVLKPDIGERGQGVAVVQDEAEASAYLQSCAHDVIAQRYVAGLEFGVFYCRQPGEAQGRILSLAGKHPLSLHGDGVQTLERLILRHPRAVAMAPYFLRKFQATLDSVPDAGEEVKLATIGTHCRGAVFTDERAHLTEALRQAIDDLTQPFTGFHYGRYDLRVPSLPDLEAGRHLQVLELNGVLAEPVHIYQPGYPLWRAWRDICHAWSEVFAAGAAMRAAGHEPPTLTEIWQQLQTHRQHDWFEADHLLARPLAP